MLRGQLFCLGMCLEAHPCCPKSQFLFAAIKNSVPVLCQVQQRGKDTHASFVFYMFVNEHCLNISLS